MFDFLKKWFYNKQEQKKQTRSLKEKSWVECNVCGYRGTMDDFLIEDSNDTKCSKCGQDEQTFEI